MQQPYVDSMVANSVWLQIKFIEKNTLSDEWQVLHGIFDPRNHKR